MAMTITGATLKYDPSPACDNTAQGVAYTEEWQVSFTGTYDHVEFNYNAYAGLPQKGQDKAGDSQAFVSATHGELERDSVVDGDTDIPGLAIWRVTYSQKAYNYELNPLDRPAEISWGGIDITTVPMKDINGNPLVNSAGELYSNLPEIPIRGGECTITRNEIPVNAFDYRRESVEGDEAKYVSQDRQGYWHVHDYVGDGRKIYCGHWPTREEAIKAKRGYC